MGFPYLLPNSAQVCRSNSVFLENFNAIDMLGRSQSLVPLFTSTIYSSNSLFGKNWRFSGSKLYPLMHLPLESMSLAYGDYQNILQLFLPLHHACVEKGGSLGGGLGPCGGRRKVSSKSGLPGVKGKTRARSIEM